MKKPVNYTVVCAILVVVQIAIGALLHLPSYLAINLLPVVVALMPVRVNTNVSLLLAFGIGLVTDLFTTGMLGFSSVALLPVALLRIPLLLGISGREILTHKSESPSTYLSTSSLVLFIFASNLVFQLIAVTMDCAGLFSAGHVILCALGSSVASTVAGYLVGRYLISEK